MESYNINYHLYADGSNLYVAFKTNDASSVKTRIESCVGDICRWMNRNDFKLNEIRKFVMALPWITWTLETKGFPYLIKPEALG